MTNPDLSSTESEKRKKKRGVIVFFLLLLLAALALTPMIDWFSPGSKQGGGNSEEVSGKFFDETPNLNLTDTTLIDHIRKILTYIYGNTNPDTHLSYSLPGDARLRYWSVSYDDVMRAIAHIRTGDLATAKRTIDYFMNNSAVQKIGYFYKNGKMVSKRGWVVNIIDASETRPGGRGIEHIAHVGPNAYLGIAALHLYEATGEGKYLTYARNRWALIKDLQNEDPKDPNYGGVRMGPLGDPNNPQEQRLDFNLANPSFYNFYNGEHAADFLALTKLLSRVDPAKKNEYDQAAYLISLWDRKIYDRRNHLFYIGTTEKRYRDMNIDRWIEPGVIPMRPLDTSALKICVYGVKGLEQFEEDGAQVIRKAIDRHFKVTVDSKLSGSNVTLTGYDFISDMDRKNLILYEEQGPMGDVKVRKGVGRGPLLSDEWSTWVAFADLRMAKDFRALGQKSKARVYLEAYLQNARGEALKSGDVLDPYTIAYPYAHPMGTGFNKPVGFGWNTHHAPYSIIGGVARILGILGADPFSLDNQALTCNVSPRAYHFARRTHGRFHSGLITEAELYVNEAWSYVQIAKKRDAREEENWVKAAAVIERMMIDHPDWTKIAEAQNRLAKSSGDEFPLKNMANLTVRNLEPVYRKYWALYHIGTGEFIRVMSFSSLARIAKSRQETVVEEAYEQKARASAQRIVDRYYYAQAYDKTGWMWQPVLSLREYVEGFDEQTSRS